MKKPAIIFFTLLAAVFALHLFSLYSQLTGSAKEEIRPEDYRFDSPPVFNAGLKTAYPPLFDIEAPAPEKSSSDEADGKKQGGNAGENGQDQLVTGDGTLRLCAVFTVAGKRLALLEIRSEGDAKLEEVREDDTMAGYRVSQVAPDRIRLAPIKGGNPVTLVIFDREKNRFAPRQRSGKTGVDKDS